MRNFRITLFLSLFVWGYNSNAQSPPGSITLPKVILPSPTASSLGHYGEVPVNLTNGTPQINIPLYELNDGGIRIPISLDYYASAIKVANTASWVGTNWSLNAGGVITRVVKGLPDEGPKGYFSIFGGALTLLSNPFVTSFNQGGLTDQQNIDYIRIVGQNWDTEPDMFYYNFLGHTGKFYFDPDRNIHLVPHDDTKIEVDNGFGQFTITTSDGAKYMFGGTGATEYTTVSSDGQASDDVYNCNSAWYLTTIVLSTGQTASLAYTSGHIITTRLAQVKDWYALFTPSPPGQFEDPSINCTQYLPVSVSNSITNHYTKILQSITSNNAIVYFDTSPNDREDLPQDHALSQIRIFSKKSNTTIKQFNLNTSYYLSPISYCPFKTNQAAETFERKKLILNSVTENFPGSTLFSKTYTFEYDSGDLPPTCSCAIDHYGNYNGANSNTTLLPKVAKMDPNGAIADREPNPVFLNNHLLNKITYPTGGYTSFTFEAPTTTIQNQINTNVTVALSLTQSDPLGTKTEAFTIPNRQDITIPFSYAPNNNLDAEVAAKVILTDAGNNILYERDFVETTSASDIKTLSLDAGNYILKIVTQYVSGTAVSASLNYVSGTATQNRTIALGSTRIKQIADYNLNGNLLKKKIYQYGDPFVQWSVAAENYSQPENIVLNYMYIYPKGCQLIECSNIEVRHVCQYQTRSSNILYNTGNFEGERVSYPTVTVLNDDNGANGKTIYTYSTANDIGLISFPYAPFTTFNWRRGLLLNQSDFDASGDKKHEIINTYDFVEKNNSLSFKLGIHDYYPVSADQPKSNNPNVLTYQSFNTISEWIKLSTHTETFYNTGSSTPITTLESNSYDSPDNVQVTKKEITKSDGKKFITFYTFPTDYAMGTQWIDDMKAARQPALPIEQVNYLNNSIINGSIMQYQPGGKGLVEKIYKLETSSPLSLAGFKFSDRNTGDLPYGTTAQAFSIDSHYKERIAFNVYDSQGNPQQITPTNGTSTTYLWGYNNQYPVAEIKNATYQDVVNALGQNAVDALNSSPGSDAQVRATLSTIRTSLPSAQITTYTYAPLIGMTSMTDAKGITTYYEYDGLQRLMNIKDKDGNIVKHMDYHYQGQ